ncbi:hypothetical protein IE53DRAFT_383148 [Violaceomyces palustris]|uniref:Uncharacterized protein n=1 Tax=Violaceomyces palustris TaxID=1673888 RepID=A0ACD0P8C7_9BASI|nr:hypothetical protein IE53DRAFT_383148 [Violaceomyces palustris]
MAGGGDYKPVKFDPAIERYTEMQATMYQRFRVTPKNLSVILTWGVAFPLLTFFGAQYFDNRYALRAKGREDSLLRKAPSAPESSE